MGLVRVLPEADILNVCFFVFLPGLRDESPVVRDDIERAGF